VSRVPIAGVLAWAVPGMGHVYLGDVRRGLVIMATIAATFWGGVAIGGVASTVNQKERTAWFMAQICTGSHGLLGHFLSRQQPDLARKTAPWMSVEVGVIYTGVAGLLNLLVVLDALSRAEAQVSGVNRTETGRPAGTRAGPKP
jgi:hypothetical protein